MLVCGRKSEKKIPCVGSSWWRSQQKRRRRCGGQCKRRGHFHLTPVLERPLFTVISHGPLLRPVINRQSRRSVAWPHLASTSRIPKPPKKKTRRSKSLSAHGRVGPSEKIAPIEHQQHFAETTILFSAQNFTQHYNI
jgi:hypothetical protein